MIKQKDYILKTSAEIRSSSLIFLCLNMVIYAGQWYCARIFIIMTLRRRLTGRFR